MSPWSPDALVLAALAFAGVAYGIRLRRLAARGRPVRPWRILAFGLAISLFAAADAAPVRRLDDRLFSIHMAQHLVIGDIAPLLAVIGLSGPLLRPVLALPGAAGLRRLASPLVALPLWAADLVTWHVPRIYDAALANSGLHAVQHLSFAVFGALLWSAILGPLPAPGRLGHGARIGALAVVWVTGGVLANVLLWSGGVLYPAYRDAPRAWGLSPLADQRVGGGLMLLEMSVVVLAAGIVLGLGWQRDAERRQRLMERRTGGLRTR
jgi:putative membrane protein